MFIESNVSDGWLSKDKTYEILEIVGSGERIKFRVISDDGSPALHSSSNFKLAILTIPNNWNFQFNEFGEWSTHPFDLPPVFWAKYFDGDIDSQEYLKSRVSS